MCAWVSLHVPQDSATGTSRSGPGTGTNGIEIVFILNRVHVALGTHVQRGLLYLVCMCVCVCVCLSVYLMLYFLDTVSFWGNTEQMPCNSMLKARYVNELVERRNFQRCMQQSDQSFNDFLVALQELAKTCYFYSEECTQKNVRNQIIESLFDGDTVEALLQERDLTTVLRKLLGAQEAAKRQRAEIASGTSKTIATIRQPHPCENTTPHQACPG